MISSKKYLFVLTVVCLELLGKKCSARKNSQCLEIQRRSPEDRVSFPKWTFLQFCKASCRASISSRFSVEHNLRRLPLKYLISQKIEIRSYDDVKKSSFFVVSSHRACHKVFSAYLARWNIPRRWCAGPLPRLRSNHYSTLWEYAQNWLILSKSIDEMVHTFWHHYFSPVHIAHKKYHFHIGFVLTKWDFFRLFSQHYEWRIGGHHWFSSFFVYISQRPPSHSRRGS